MTSMNSGETLTRVTIWITILGYAVGTALFALSRKRHKWDSAARIAWTAACIGLLAHVTSAFHFYHDWSHNSAYRDTARQTGEVFGFNWGGGLYVNYLLLVVWVVDVIWWWLGGLEAYRRRPWLLVAAWQAFLIFIIFNGTVVFATGFVRWTGLCICLGLGFIWWRAVRGNSSRKSVEFPPTTSEV
jgi:hypothetical protein